jgi:hypothetical protein
VARNRDELRQAPPQLPRRRQPLRHLVMDQIRLDQHGLVAPQKLKAFKTPERARHRAATPCELQR